MRAPRSTNHPASTLHPTRSPYTPGNCVCRLPRTNALREGTFARRIRLLSNPTCRPLFSYASDLCEEGSSNSSCLAVVLQSKAAVRNLVSGSRGCCFVAAEAATESKQKITVARIMFQTTPPSPSTISQLPRNPVCRIRTTHLADQHMRHQEALSVTLCRAGSARATPLLTKHDWTTKEHQSQRGFLGTWALFNSNPNHVVATKARKFSHTW